MTGQEPAQVKLRFGKLFAIDDPERVERFFSGETVILRRNLERKEAAQCYQDLRKLGAVATLVKISTREVADSKTSSTPQEKPASRATKKKTSNNIPPSTAAQELAEKTRREAAEAAEQAARRKAKKAEQKAERARVKAAEAAKLRAELQETRRREEEERHSREEEEKRRREEEAAAKLEAERKTKKRREAEEAARTKAELEQKKIEEAQKAAKRQAELEEKKRQEAEEASRKKAELEQKKIEDAQKAAKRQAELEELERQESEEAARLDAELDEIKRQEVEAAARIKAETQRKLAEAQRQSDERRRLTAEKLAARQETKGGKTISRQAAYKAEKSERKRRKNKKLAKRRKEQQHDEAVEQQEQTAQRAALEEQPVQRAAQELAHQPALKPARASVKTNLEIPVRTRGGSSEGVSTANRRRQAGEPNLYILRPFRNTPDVRARAELANRRKRRGYLLGALAFIALLIAGLGFIWQPAATIIHSTGAIAVDPKSGPLLLAGDSLFSHNRAGIGTEQITLSSLGLASLEAPMAFDDSGTLIALGRLGTTEANPEGNDASQVLRCKLEPPDCQHFSSELEDSRIDAFALHPINGNLVLADSSAGELLKISPDGTLLARTFVVIPEQPILRLHAGLLLMNSATGPGISVFRYEDSAFGKQLDEILLLPPVAVATGKSSVGDFIWSGGSWWASLRNPESGSIGLYRFDEQWNYLDTVILPVHTGPLQLANWGEKTLVNDQRGLAIQRFNAQGVVEAPFVSTQLEDQVVRHQHQANVSTLAWPSGLLILALAVLTGFGFAYLQSLRSLVYKSKRERGAEPIDDYAQALRWIEPLQNRSTVLRRRNFTYGLLVLGILLLAIGQNIALWHLIALLIALSGPAIALQLLSRRPIGNIGIVEGELLLVDHRGMYHIGGGARVQHRGHFLMIDDVVVFTGSRLLPAFSTRQVQELIRPLAIGTVKVDRRTLAVKLLECGHPIAQGAIAIIAALTAAGSVLCLYTII